MSGASPSRPTARRRLARGFTLVELLVTLVISSVVVSAAVTGIVALNDHAILTKRRAELESEAKILTERFVSELQAVGGGSFRPWSVLTVVNNHDGTGSDELIIADIDDSLGECAIVDRPGSGAVFVLGNDDEGNCCLDQVGEAAWEGRVLMAVNGNGAMVKVMRSNNANSSNCHINFPSGFGGGPTDELDKLAGDPTDFVGGAIAAVRLRKYRVDHTKNELILEVDSDGDGTLEQHVVADRVYDLQVALGYDTDQDRDVEFNGTTADEFLFNAPGDEMGEGGLSGARESQLRLAQIGLIVGVPAGRHTLAAKALDGPTRTANGVLLRATHGRAFLRNLSLYDQ